MSEPTGKGWEQLDVSSRICLVMPDFRTRGLHFAALLFQRSGTGCRTRLRSPSAGARVPILGSPVIFPKNLVIRFHLVAVEN